MKLYAIRRPSAWAGGQELEAAAAKSARIGNVSTYRQVRSVMARLQLFNSGERPRLDGVTIVFTQ